MTDSVEGAPPNEVDRAVEAARAEEAAQKPPAPRPTAAKRGRGRPPGSRTRKPAAAAAVPEEPPQGAPEEPIEVTEAEIMGLGGLWAIIWRLSARSGRCRPLTLAEQREIGEATVPVMRKYAPSLERYAAEINLGVVVVGMISATAMEPAAVPAPSAPPPPEAPDPGAVAA